MKLACDIPGGLTERERQLVELLADGMKNAEIAEAMGITNNYVKIRLVGIYDKLGMFNRLELALWALEHEANQV